jgi:hypothetical protein
MSNENHEVEKNQIPPVTIGDLIRQKLKEKAQEPQVKEKVNQDFVKPTFHIYL